MSSVTAAAKTHSKRPSKRSRKSTTETVPVAAPLPDVAEVLIEQPVVVAPVVAQVVDEVGVAPATRTSSSRPTRDELLEFADSLFTIVDSEHKQSLENKKREVRSAVFRDIKNAVKKLRRDIGRAIKVKGVKRTAPNNTGFNKPVAISPALAKFAGWNASDLKSRTDVTRFLCAYIADKNLQNPEDRRQIKPDNRLAKLLDYDSKDEKPLTYFRLQPMMQRHYLKPATDAIAATA